MLDRLPGILRHAHVSAATANDDRCEAQRLLALASHAAAMVLTKLGELDLAWTAADRGVAAAHHTGDEAVIASLSRSVVHTLQSHGRTAAATRLTEKSADRLRKHLTPTAERSASVYGTLLLAGAMASARAGDRASANDYLDEADAYAGRMGREANYLWTAFGPTNVAIHRVATAVSLGDMGVAHAYAGGIDASRLPLERRVRYAFDLAKVCAEHREVDRALANMLAAERLAPEQVHHHVISRQVIAELSSTSEGARNAELRLLAQRVQRAQLVAVASPG